MKLLNSHLITRTSIVFLQIGIVLLGTVVLALLLVEPHFEGRNAQASYFEIYFNDLFLAYVYLGSIPFFVALFQAFKLLNYVRRCNVFTKTAVNATRIIKYCSFLTAGLIVVAGVYLRLNAHGSDDPAGAIMLGLIAALISIVIGTIALILEGTLQDGEAIKSENDHLKKKK